MTIELIASMVLAIWLYLLLSRGGFWLARERDDDIPAGEHKWPTVTAVIPARDEAECIGATVASLLGQDYSGEFSVIVVDDQSRDATAHVARDAAAALDATQRLKVLPGRALPAGWTGKVWAQQQGVEATSDLPHPPVYLLFTDADINHAPDSLRTLVERALVGRLCAHLADGEATLRELGRAHVHPRVHFLFPDALPVRMVE